MKINKLHLRAYGHFTDTLIDFSGSKFGLHLIYGDNEAGKSTSMRSLTDFLFGFEHISNDGWMHGNKQLKVSGEILLADGSTLHLSRYKRRNNDLIDESTSEPFPQEKLNLELRNMTREAFLHAFGISHDSLRLGVDSILAAGGDLGHALFTATSGLNSLQQLMIQLETQQKELFSPKAKKATINANVRQINDLGKQLKQTSLSVGAWEDCQEQLKSLENKESKLLDDIIANQEELQRKKRYFEGIKYISPYSNILAELEQVGDVPDLDERFSEQRIEILSTLKELQFSIDEDRSQVESLTSKIDTILPDARVLAQRENIERIHQEVGVHNKAANDRKSIQARIHLLESQALNELQKLRPGLTVELANSLLPSLAELHTLQNLSKQKVELDASMKHLETIDHKLSVEQTQAEEGINDVIAPEGLEQLSSLLENLTEEGGLEETIQELDSQMENANTTIHRQLSRLVLWQGSMEQFCQQPFPGVQTVRLFEKNIQRLGNEKDILQTALDDQQKQIHQKLEQLQQLKRYSQAPEREEIRLARELRDSGWQTVQDVWIRGNEPKSSFLDSFPEGTGLESAFEQSLLNADQLADQYLDHAEDGIQAENLEEEIRQLRETLTKTTRDLEQSNTRLEQEEERWRATWVPCNIDPLSPEEMLAWLDESTLIISAIEDLLSLQTSQEQAVKRLAAQKNTLEQALKKNGLVVEKKSSIRELISIATTFVKNKKSLEIRANERSRRIEAIKAELNQTADQLKENRGQHQLWLEHWHKAILPLGFDENAGVEEVTLFVATMQSLSENLVQIQEMRIRDNAMQKDYTSFSERVKQISTQLNIDTEHTPVEQQVQRLHALNRLHLDKEQQRVQLEEKLTQLSSALRGREEKQVTLQEQLSHLCQQAGAQSVEDLPPIEQKVRQKRQLHEKLNQLSSKIETLTGGLSISAFFSTLDGLDQDSLLTQIERLEDQLQQQKDAQRKLIEDIALARSQRDSFDGTSKAALIAEERQDLILATEGAVQEYIRLKIASSVLAKTVEQYRKNNQSPILLAAGEYFHQLTGGSFTAIRADYDDRGNPVMRAERPDGSRLFVDELSDGSRDQLFLSLRLGSLSRHTAIHGPMPFIVDDILVHFDDIRAASALSALHSLAEHTQVVFFTHHQHLIDLSRKCLPTDNLYVHSLD